MVAGTEVAVVTGAASGIGLALAKVCLEANMQLVMVDINAPLLQAKVAELNATSSLPVLAKACDVANWDAMLQLAQDIMSRYGRVDFLFNNAGISGPLGSFWEISPTEIRKVLDINLFGIVHGVNAFLPFMLQQSQRSHLINMASFYGLCSGAQMAPYAMSKHAIVALSESLYFDLKRQQKPVDIAVVCPSFVNTDLLAERSIHSDSMLKSMVHDFMAYSRSADDVAKYILQEVKNQTFYILPDPEVKDYCQKRVDAITHGLPPDEHSIEKIMAVLSERASQHVCDN